MNEIEISPQSRMKDITGQKFNMLTALKPLYKSQHHRGSWVWLCLCDCGKETKVAIGKLTGGYTKSCGCFKARNLRRWDNYGPEHHMWAGYEGLSLSFYSRIRDSAINRNIEFNLSMEYLYNLFIRQKGICAYSGVELRLPIHMRQLRGENEDVASLDRVDNSKGYIEGNVQWVSKRANYMKHTMQEDYFFDWIKKIYEYRLK